MEKDKPKGGVSTWFWAFCGVLIFMLFKSYTGDSNQDSQFDSEKKTGKLSLGSNSHKATSDDSINQFEKTQSSQTDIIYSIIEETEDIGIPQEGIEVVSVYTARIRIPDRITEGEIKKLAITLKKIRNTKAKGIRYWFYLPGMNKDDMAWATAVFHPNLEVKIIGRTIDVEKVVQSNLNNIEDYVGIWDGNYAEDVVMRIRKDKSLGYLYELISTQDPKPGPLPDLLKLEKKNGKVMFKVIESNYGEYFIIEENGDLSDWNDEGHIETFKVLKYRGVH